MVSKMLTSFILATTSNDMCDEIITINQMEHILNILKYVNIIVPILTIIFIMFDVFSVITKNNMDDLNNLIRRSAKRLVITVCFLLLPSFVVAAGKFVLTKEIFETKVICVVYPPKREVEVIEYGNNTNGSSSSNFCVSGKVTEGPGGEYYPKQICANSRVYKIYKQHLYGKTQFFGRQNMKDNGCSVTTLAIIMSGFDPSIEPLQLRKYFNSTSWNTINNAAYSEGFTFARVPKTPAKIREAFSKGRPLMTLIHYRGGGGHYISLLGENPDGTLILGNSVNGLEKTTIESFLKSHNLSNMYEIYK